MIAQWRDWKRKGSSRLHRWPRIFIGVCVVCGGNLERRYFCRGRWGVGNFRRVRYPCSETQLKEVLRSKNGEEFVFPFADGSVNMAGRDQVFRKSLNARSSCTRRGAQRCSSRRVGRVSTVRQQTRDAESWDDFRSISGNHIYRHHVQPRLELFLPKEGSFLQGRGQVFPSSHNIERKASKWFHVVWRSGPTLYGQIFGRTCWKAIKKMKNGIGRLKHRSPTALESWEPLLTSIRKTRSSGKPWRMRTNFSKWQLNPQSSATFSISTERLGAHNAILETQDTIVLLKSINLRERALERLNPEIMKISLLRRYSIQCVIVILYTRWYPYSKQWRKFRTRQPQWAMCEKSSKNCQHGKWRRSGAKKRPSKWHKQREWPFILRRWWIFATSRRTLSSSSGSRNKKVVWYSDVMWWKTILARIQHPWRSVRPHHKLRPRKNLDVIARLPGCAGQGSDSVSACTQVKKEDAPILTKYRGSECPEIWIRLPRFKWQRGWHNIEEPVVFLDRTLCGQPVAGLLWVK